MSRMLAYVADRSLTPVEASGEGLLDTFAQLASLHADGWGTAWVDDRGDIASTGGVEAFVPADLDGADASPARLLYLRFASTGSPALPENTQPFVRDGLAFQHNGLLSPREPALNLLSPAEVGELVGTTDSEVYFSVVRRHLRAADSDSSSRRAAIAAAVNEVRAVYPDACLNAFVLDHTGLFVVHSSGRAATPLPAFAERGFTADRLPPGHGDDYNTLSVVRVASGAFVVATTGVDQRGWETLPTDTVSQIDADGGVRNESVTTDR